MLLMMMIMMIVTVVVAMPMSPSWCWCWWWGRFFDLMFHCSLFCETLRVRLVSHHLLMYLLIYLSVIYFFRGANNERPFEETRKFKSAATKFEFRLCPDSSCSSFLDLYLWVVCTPELFYIGFLQKCCNNFASLNCWEKSSCMKIEFFLY